MARRTYLVDLPDGTVQKRVTDTREYTHVIVGFGPIAKWDPDTRMMLPNPNSQWVALSWAGSAASAIARLNAREYHGFEDRRVLPAYLKQK